MTGPYAGSNYCGKKKGVRTPEGVRESLFIGV